MKVTVNVDCTPEEARQFLGLPDVKPMQDALMADLESNLRTGMQALTPDALMKNWIPSTMKGADQVQKLFWGQMQKMFSGMPGSPNLMLNIKDKDEDKA